MKLIRRKAKPVSVFLAILMLSITFPLDSVLAAMIGTDATLGLTRAQQARDDINNLLLREDVQNALMAQGIDPLEAKTQIDSLSDVEVIRIADEIDKLPAGAGGMFDDMNINIGPPGWLIAVIIAAVVLIIVGIVWLATTDWEDTDKK